MYPTIYHAVKDLLGIDLPFLRMVQSFGFFVALAFLVSAYFWTQELKRIENNGLLSTTTVKILKGQKATVSELITAAIIGFFIGYKLLYIALDFSAFTENTQGFILSTKGNFLGALVGAVVSVYLKFSEKEKTKLIRRLRHELDMEKQNSEKKDYRKIYNRFKERLENLGKDSLEESKKILDSY